jgi:hypothetical protein
MEVEIIKEQQVENKVYFELKPLDTNYKDKFLFGVEMEADFNNEQEMILLRAEVITLASDEFDKQLLSIS